MIHSFAWTATVKLYPVMHTLMHHFMTNCHIDSQCKPRSSRSDTSHHEDHNSTSFINLCSTSYSQALLAYPLLLQVYCPIHIYQAGRWHSGIYAYCITIMSQCVCDCRPQILHSSTISITHYCTRRFNSSEVGCNTSWMCCTDAKTSHLSLIWMHMRSQWFC